MELFIHGEELLPPLVPSVRIPLDGVPLLPEPEPEPVPPPVEDDDGPLTLPLSRLSGLSRNGVDDLPVPEPVDVPVSLCVELKRRFEPFEKSSDSRGDIPITPPPPVPVPFSRSLTDGELPLCRSGVFDRLTSQSEKEKQKQEQEKLTLLLKMV